MEDAGDYRIRLRVGLVARAQDGLEIVNRWTIKSVRTPGLERTLGDTQAKPIVQPLVFAPLEAHASREDAAAPGSGALHAGRAQDLF